MDITKKTLNLFRCNKCGRKAQTLKEERALSGLCRVCRNLKVDPNQLLLA
jgi:ribosomal protein S14